MEAKDTLDCRSLVLGMRDHLVLLTGRSDENILHIGQVWRIKELGVEHDGKEDFTIIDFSGEDLIDSTGEYQTSIGLESVLDHRRVRISLFSFFLKNHELLK